MYMCRKLEAYMHVSMFLHAWSTISCLCFQPCVPGYYCPEGSHSQYEHPCPIGTFSNRTGATSLADCSLCPAGYYCEEPGLTAATKRCRAVRSSSRQTREGKGEKEKHKQALNQRPLFPDGLYWCDLITAKNRRCIPRSPRSTALPTYLSICHSESFSVGSVYLFLCLQPIYHLSLSRI